MNTQDYRIVRQTPPLEDFLRLRRITGLTVYSQEAARKGLEGTIVAALVLKGETVVGMGRLVGDGGCVFIIADVAVDPAHQGKGLGKRIMAELMDYVNTELGSKAYVSLVADLPADKLYASFGFEPVAPASIGMAYRVP
ncbi:Acetyltransferase (GNAT) domain-containing protein [Cohaesibacter sp. ES.047]|uniref:GNAT family N-acetyltransferase n=1 Tax=Cohaesibacter sp. ES.047 TaxID=1798205 RepID=UPI000BB7017D|nr:GNAT family N-acetyltransferase [Cohaesibacter sp. ES.047]SNY91058.1 Acetyltransferase (GNAT) domain-containing protein [Cohaesibacter sp. ES.047]